MEESRPYRLASRESRPGSTEVRVRSVPIGGPRVVLIAGPCAVESEEQTLEVARAVREAGATILRGGAFKPRTSPYTFQGLGVEGLRILERARRETGLPICTEALDEESLDHVAATADLIQIGARNMQNFPLLKRAGRTGLPVLLKRGMGATLEEWLCAAEHILDAGNPNVVLCERGIRTFANHARYTLDLSVIPALRDATHLPVVVDPSHGTGVREWVAPMARAAVAAGADGLLIEVHGRPDEALCDGAQALLPAQFAALARELAPAAAAAGRPLAG